MMTMAQIPALKIVEQGMAFQYALKAPSDLPVLQDARECIAIPIMKRKEGIMIVVPLGFFLEEALFH